MEQDDKARMIERLRASKARDAEEAQLYARRAQEEAEDAPRIGKELGRRWAMEDAAFGELQSLAELSSARDISYALHFWSRAILYYMRATISKLDDAEAEKALRLLDNRELKEELHRSFWNGAMEIWNEIKDEI